MAGTVRQAQGQVTIRGLDEPGDLGWAVLANGEL